MEKKTNVFFTLLTEKEKYLIEKRIKMDNAVRLLLKNLGEVIDLEAQVGSSNLSMESKTYSFFINSKKGRGTFIVKSDEGCENIHFYKGSEVIKRISVNKIFNYEAEKFLRLVMDTLLEDGYSFNIRGEY